MRVGLFMRVCISFLSIGILLQGCTIIRKEAVKNELVVSNIHDTMKDEPAEDTFRYTIYWNYDWKRPPEVLEPIEHYPTMKYVFEELKVEPIWISAGGNATLKLNTMIVAKDLPDVIVLDRGTDTERLAKAGLIVPLEDFYEEYPNLKKYIGDRTLNLLRSKDGHIYGIPQYYADEQSITSGSGWFINKLIYKELGEPKLETFQDLYNYLLAVQEYDPSVVPLDTPVYMGTSQLLLLAYAGMGGGRSSNISFRQVEDRLESVYEDPAFEDAQKYVSRLFRQQLISPSVLTQRADQLKEKLNNGKIAVYAGLGIGNDIKYANHLLTSNEVESGYEVIWPIHKTGVDPKDVIVERVSFLGWNLLTISSYAENPERIFAFYDFISSPEQQRILTFGPKGLYWDTTDVDGTPIPNQKYHQTSAEQMDRMRIDSNPWYNMPVLQPWYNARNKYVALDRQDHIGYITNRTIRDNTMFDNIDPPAASLEGVIKTNVEGIISRSNLDILFAADDQEVANILTATRHALSNAGYDNLLTYWNVKWRQNQTKAAGEK